MFIEYAKTEDEARDRASAARDVDPFSSLAPALLSAEHILDYVKQTGMLFPFHPEKKDSRLKPASYELHLGNQLIRWDENGKRIIDKIEELDRITFKANSITFIQVESKFRLPNYIAARFNLRIQHVHRGLLLGTGPLIDPGFTGDLLIPVHNLTADDYTIRKDEGIIWVEFTKTSRGLKSVSGDFRPFEPRKTDRDPEYYFQKASNNNPIRSSIPDVYQQTKKDAANAARDARRAARASRFFAGIGAAAVLATVLGLASFLATMHQNILDAVDAARAAELAAHDVAALRQQIRETRDRIDDLEAEIQRLNQPSPAQPTP